MDFSYICVSKLSQSVLLSFFKHRATILSDIQHWSFKLTCGLLWIYRRTLIWKIRNYMLRNQIYKQHYQSNDCLPDCLWASLLFIPTHCLDFCASHANHSSSLPSFSWPSVRSPACLPISPSTCLTSSELTWSDCLRLCFRYTDLDHP